MLLPEVPKAMAGTLVALTMVMRTSGEGEGVAAWWLECLVLLSGGRCSGAGTATGKAGRTEACARMRNRGREIIMGASMPLHVLKGRDQFSRSIGCEAEQGLKNDTRSGMVRAIQGFPDDEEMEDTGLECAVADDFSKGLLTRPVKDIGHFGVDSGDVFSKRRGKRVRIAKFRREKAKIGEAGVGAVFFQ